MVAPLVVEGRPGVTFVAGMPHTWTTVEERLILLVIAVDGYLKPAEDLARSCGLRLDDVVAHLQIMSHPRQLRDGSERPALLPEVLARLNPSAEAEAT